MKDTEARLQFVTAEEAAKWPEGTYYLAHGRWSGKVHWATGRILLRHQIERAAESGFILFARLPDTLPELEGKDG